MAYIKNMISITTSYWGGLFFPLIFCLALILILLFEKEKIKKVAFLWYSIIVLILIYNPITYLVCTRIFEKSTFDQYYKRFYALIMVLIVIAYGFTLVLAKLKGVRKLVATLAIVLVVALLGKSIYTEDWFTKAENRLKVPQDVVTISDVFADYEGDTIRIMAPQDVAVYLRQIDSRFSMPYGRSLPKEAYELTNEQPNPKTVADYCKANDVNFVVVSAAESVLNTYLNYGYEQYGRTTYYAILTPPEGSWILTEYGDQADLQCMCYTMYNENDGTLIVIDGGHEENEDMLRDAIEEYGGVVDAWILTHYHKDHIDAFNAIYEDPEDIQIKDIYITPMESDLYHSIAREWDDIESFEKYKEITNEADNIHEVTRDEVLNFSDGLSITFFNTCDDVVKGYIEDIPNDASLVFKMQTDSRSILFCADCHTKYMADYLVSTYGDALSADILQCGHHGNNSMPTETGFYETVNPEIAIFDGPDWLMLSPDYTAATLAEYLRNKDVRILWFNTAPNMFVF